MSKESQHHRLISDSSTADHVDADDADRKDLTSVQKRLYADSAPNALEGRSNQEDETVQAKPSSVRDQERQRARNEAERVLERCSQSQHNVDGFNLLGVVADPRGPGSQFAAPTTSTSITPSSFHGRYGGASPDAPSSPGRTPNSYFGASYYYQSFESTLTSMTGQMGALNHVLEDWSRQILEEGEYNSSGLENEIPESQLKELPPEIENPDLSVLATYREHSESLATSFTKRVAPSAMRRTASSKTRDNPDELIDVSDVPSDFFVVDYDLTDPATFRKILLAGAENDLDKALCDDADASVYELLPLIPQDALSSYLDNVELALLQQVRANSDKFFSESQRFALLQEWIQSLLQEVVQLQTTTGYLQSDMLQPMETVPMADTQRADLRSLELVLGRAEDMLLCKHSLGGVLSAQDDMTAIEQIQYARRLLNGTWQDAQDEEPTVSIELGRLRSFKAASDQLDQYQQVVVANMRDELIELFLAWNNTCSKSGDAIGFANGTATSNNTKSQSSISHQEQQIRTRVRDITKALQACGALSKTREAYATRLQDVIRMTVRTTVGEFASDVAPSGAVQSVAMGTSSMSLNRFLDCLDMLFEQLLALLTSAHDIDCYFVAERLPFSDNEEKEFLSSQQNTEPSNDESTSTSAPVTPLLSVVANATELSAKSVSELLRLRKEAHSLVSLAEIKAMWDACTGFALQLDKLSGSAHTSTLRSALSAQAKAFLERKHESNMSALAAALDSERWVQCEVAASRQTALTRLCSGLSVVSSPMKRSNGSDAMDTIDAQAKRPDLEAEGTRYKVVWSCLLLVEMILNNIATAAHFPSMASGIVSKVAELLRLFNSRTTQLVLGAGAIHSHAKLKSINAKHLSLVTQCLGMVVAILPHIRTGLTTHLPKKQWTLLACLDHIRKEFGDHNEKILNKFVSIIGGIVEHNLAKKIPGTDFDERAKLADNVEAVVDCCPFLDDVSANTRKMHQVLYSLLPPDHLIDTFSRIFAFLDSRVPALFIAAANIQPVFQKPGASSPVVTAAKGGQAKFTFPKSDIGKKRFLLEVEAMTKNLNRLEGVRPWEFEATNVIGRELEFSLRDGPKKLAEANTASAEATEVAQGDAVQTSETETPRLDDDKENGTLESGDVLHPVEDELLPSENTSLDSTAAKSSEGTSGGGRQELPATAQTDAVENIVEPVAITTSDSSTVTGDSS